MNWNERRESSSLHQEATSTTRFPPALARCLWLMLVAIAVCLATELVCAKVLHWNDPVYTWPLRIESVRFPDLLLFYPRFKDLHTLRFFQPGELPLAMYPATMDVVLDFFYSCMPHAVAAYLTLGIGALTIAAGMFTRGLESRGISRWKAAAFTGLGLLCCYPVWFALGQANMEIVVWMLLASGVGLLLRRHSYGAAICFGLAASLKIYPALFLALPLLRREYRQVMAGIAVGAVYMVASLFFVGPTFSGAYHGVEHNLNAFRMLYMLRVRNESGIDHSLFGLFKLSVRHHPGGDAWMSPRLTAYLAVMTICVLILLVWKVRHLPTVNQLLFCTLVCVLCPPTSFEYTLLQMMTMLCVLALVAARRAQQGRGTPGLAAALLLCAGTQLFLPELSFHRLQLDGPVKCLILIALMFVCLRYPFATEEWTPPSSGAV